jgi:putative ABC transport system permease protein
MEREPAWRRYLHFWRSNPDVDIDDEVGFHVDSRTAEFVAAGMNAADARRAAADRFGNTDDILHSLHILTRQRETAMRRTAWLQTIRQDLQFACRQLLRNPGFTIVAVLTLALGIGANTAIFSVVYSVLLKPLPYAAPAERLVSLRERNGPADQQGMVVTSGNFTEWQRQSRLFEAFGALGGGGFTLTGAGDPQQVQARRVSAGYWKVEYIPPVVGRYFGEAEDSPDAPHVVVLSSALWRSTPIGRSSGARSPSAALRTRW